MDDAQESGDGIRVQDLMTVDPIVVAPEVTLERVMALMQKASIRHIPVVDEQGIVGIVSDLDLKFIHSIPGVFDSVEPGDVEDALQAPVGVVMKSRFLIDRDVTSLQARQPLKEAVDLLLGSGLRTLPVLDDDNEVVGILSAVDILRWVSDDVL